MEYRPPRRRNDPPRPLVSRVFYMPAPDSRSFLALSNKGKGWIGGGLESSPPCSPAVRSFSYAHWCGDCAVPILWLTCPISASGTRYCLGSDFSYFAFVW